jgi:polyhydroxyalkanoate synthesis repressor PhaR
VRRRPPFGARPTKPLIIKRYANRRLYNSNTGQYISRKSLEELARRGEEFVVEDTATGQDITHSVLGQIIVAQEAAQSEPMLPNEFMRRLLTFYGDTLQVVLRCYLDFSLMTISNESVRDRVTESGSAALKLMDEQVQHNIKFFEAILLNFSPAHPDRAEGEQARGGQAEP